MNISRCVIPFWVLRDCYLLSWMQNIFGISLSSYVTTMFNKIYFNEQESDVLSHLIPPAWL